MNQHKGQIDRFLINFFVLAIWSTRYTQDLVDNEAKAKTLLRELIIYLLFTVIMCTSKYIYILSHL